MIQRWSCGRCGKASANEDTFRDGMCPKCEKVVDVVMIWTEGEDNV